MKITFLDAKTVGELKELSELEKFGELKLFQATSSSQVLGRVRDSDVIITNKVVIDKKVIANAPCLKLICVAATGMNNIDLEAAMKAGVAVENVKGYSTDSVAQHTFALLFNLINHISYYSQYVRSGKYSRKAIFTCLDKDIYEVKGKTLGIIGLGAIGVRVAEIAKSFGMDVVYYSTSGKHHDIRYRRVELDEILNISDVISVHAPLNENTKGLIGEKEFKKMKKDCILLNTGRGGIIREKDLVSALNKNLIAAAGVDVFEKEPLPLSHPFFKVKQKEKLLLTPHIAWASIEARRTLIKGVCENIKRFIQQKN